jgi:hypothetical protein
LEGLQVFKVTLLAFAVSLLAFGFNTDPVQAQPLRVFVAAAGNDANPCSFAQPCGTFQRAHDVVAARGEIEVLDPVGYGAVTITKAITIQGHGIAGIAAAANSVAITINAGQGDDIILSGLHMRGSSLGGGTGILFNSGGSLTVRNCEIDFFANVGIWFLPVGASELLVSNTLLSGNGTAIIVNPQWQGATGIIDHVQAVNSRAGAGLAVSGSHSQGPVQVTVSESVMASSLVGGTGIAVESMSGGAPTTVTVRNSTITGNGSAGLQVDGPRATMRVTRSTITGNGTGLSILNGGQLLSYGDNNIDGNTINGAATSTALH